MVGGLPGVQIGWMRRGKEPPERIVFSRRLVALSLLVARLAPERLHFLGRVSRMLGDLARVSQTSWHPHGPACARWRPATAGLSVALEIVGNYGRGRDQQQIGRSGRHQAVIPGDIVDTRNTFDPPMGHQ
jgi:hypothetical protein